MLRSRGELKRIDKEPNPFQIRSNWCKATLKSLKHDFPNETWDVLENFLRFDGPNNTLVPLSWYYSKEAELEGICDDSSYFPGPTFLTKESVQTGLDRLRKWNLVDWWKQYFPLDYRFLNFVAYLGRLEQMQSLPIALVLEAKYSQAFRFQSKEVKHNFLMGLDFAGIPFPRAIIEEWGRLITPKDLLNLDLEVNYGNLLGDCAEALGTFYNLAGTKLIIIEEWIKFSLQERKWFIYPKLGYTLKEAIAKPIFGAMFESKVFEAEFGSSNVNEFVGHVEDLSLPLTVEGARKLGMLRDSDGQGRMGSTKTRATEDTRAENEPLA